MLTLTSPLDLDPDASPCPEAAPPPRPCASPEAPGPVADPTPPATETVCEACGDALSTVQVAKGARACGSACRARASRDRRKARRLADIDAAIRTLQELRADVERAP